VSLEDSALAVLLTPAPNKQPVTNKNVTADGAYVLESTAGLTDETTFSVQMHIVASSRAEYYTKFSQFISAIKGGSFTITVYDWNLQAHSRTVCYLDCQNYKEYRGELGIFTLSLYEPNHSAS
jgi:hypothetical protein